MKPSDTLRKLVARGTQRLSSFAVLGFLVSLVPAANGACTSPAGVQGELRWNSPLTQFCDGTVWQSTTVTTTGTNCSTAGQLTYASGILNFCNGTKLVQTNGATNGSCTAAQAGAFLYSTTVASEQYCNGTNWLQMHSNSAAAFVQQVAGGYTVSSLKITSSGFPSGTTVGNLIICSTNINASYSVSSVTDNKGNTFTRILTPQTGFPGYTMEVWYAPVTTAGTAETITVNFPSGSNGKGAALDCAEFSGMLVVNSVDQAVYTTGTSDVATGPTLTLTSPKELVYVSTLENNTCTAISGWSDITSYYGDYVGYKAVSSGGPTPTGTSSGCGSQWGMFAISFRSK